MSKCIIEVIIDEYGSQEVLKRLANPYWFQALSCVLGYDWHSSGTTTVTCATLKEVLQPGDHGLAVAGGKGKASHRTPEEIKRLGQTFGWSDEQISKVNYASRMSAKVDNTAIQAGYPLYHHAFFVDIEGKWVVIQQGLNVADRTARRYHWLSDHIERFVVEPHVAIVGNTVKSRVLDMTALSSEGNRKISVDLVNDGPKRIQQMITAMRPRYQATLKQWITGIVDGKDYAVDLLYMPRRMNWEALKRAYEVRPNNYEELLGMRGIGPATVRGLALVSEIVYGEEPSWKDPLKYSFAYGGKDGVPFPVDVRAMDTSIHFLQEAIERTKVGQREKILALKRLKKLSNLKLLSAR